VCWQVTNYERFACARPQICPDVGGADVQIFNYAMGEDTAPVPVQVLLTNCSTGTNDLVIDRVEVFGDARCAFSEVTDADIGSKILAPGETTAIRSTYQPGAPGEDHAELRVYSNAQNFPELRLLVCGVAWVSHGDAGPQDATAADAGCSEWTCVNGGKGCLPQTGKTPCHE
jgi:hypothetical protein